jgi:diguanylate cyclase (GGDEF)-like protein
MTETSQNPSPEKPTALTECGHGQACRLARITPLVQQINCLDIKQIAEICVKDVASLIGARYASLYILDETSDMLHLAGCNHPFLINNIVSLNQANPSPMVGAVRSKTLLVVDDIDKHNKPNLRKSPRAYAKNYQTKNCIIAPLICQDRVVGVLNLSDKIGVPAFAAEDIAVIELFRYLVGASVGNVKLFEKSQRQARTDGLTGLSNYRTFYEMLERELRRSNRYGGYISVIMADLDNLKVINDKYGHRAGDMAIKHVSRKITESIRQIDTAARYGGDEFAVILPNTVLANALTVGQRIVDLTSGTDLIWEQNHIKVSVSVGVGQYDGSWSPEDITHRSDEALYYAKQAGKNTVRVIEHAKKLQ